MKQVLIITLFFFLSSAVFAQDDLLASLEEEQSQEETLVEATFKGTRVINGHSIETRKRGVMDFIISHRFGTIDGGSYELYGLDNATIRFGLEYAITDRIYVGLGRSSFEKTYDGFAKIRLLRQSDGKGSMPISITSLSSMSVKTLKNPEIELDFKERMASTHQLLIARKFSNSISIQLMPTWVHRNLIEVEYLNNDIYALGFGGRIKLSQRVALCGEYYYQFQKLHDNTTNSLAIGFDIETGGHVFQLQFTNATSMVPKGFITETTNSFSDKEIHFGFNVSRTFQVN